MSSNIRIKRICMHCGEQFIAKTTITKYCSHKCNSRDYKMKIKELKIKVSNKETGKIIPQQIKYPELNQKELLSIKEACQFLGMSKSSVYRLIKDGRLKPLKIRNRVLIKKDEINDLLNKS